MSNKEASKVLKRKYSSMTPRRGQIIGSKQDEMEKQLIGYIRELRGKNQRVTRNIIFRKALQLFPLFKGGIHSSTFLAGIKSWFYMGFKKDINSNMCI